MRVETATWANCRADFALDGAFVDLIVRGTEPAEWELFWATLRSGPFGLRTYRDGEPISLPKTAAEIFAEREVASMTVSVLVGAVTANCHFFGGDLELDIDPREVVSEAAFESVVALMRFISITLGRPVLATPESGGAKHAFLRVSMDGHAAFLPP